MAFRATAFQRRLEDAGFDAKMAYAQTAAIEELVVEELVSRDYMDSKFSAAHSEGKADSAISRSEFKADISTLRSEFKADIAALRSEFKADLAALRSGLKADIATTELRLIRWMVGTVAGATLAIILTILRVAK